jgi:hypothetical protein
MIKVEIPTRQWDQALANQPEDEEGAHDFQEVRPENVIRFLGVLPSEVLVGFLRDGRLQVHSPITVRFKREHRQFVAEAAEFNEFGFGETWSEALADLQRAIAELYFMLDEEQARLGSDLHRTWAALQQKIRRRR